MLTDTRERRDRNKKNKPGWKRYLPMAAVLAVFSSGLFSRCANIQGAPEGGPKDTLPPRVVRMTPAFNSTGIRPKRIIIDFDEYIQLKNQQEEFFTSPFMEVKPTISYKNRSVIIDIDSPMDSATTYVLNLGSSVVDNNEGNPMHALKYTFSTGSHIDSMFMSGYVSDALTADTLKGAYVFFYDARLDSVPDRDSLLFDTWKASAVTKTLSDGGFVFSNLKDIDYRVYALMDNNKNQIYDPGTDEVAFLDSVYNPAKLPSFLMWYDTVRRHPVAEPQLFFRAFRENADRRQNLSTSGRPSAQQIMLKFSSRNPKIERFDLQGIDPSKVIVEQTREDRDSILYWLNIPAEELPDTILADLIYERHDSAGQLYWHEQQLRFVFKKPFVATPREKAKGGDSTRMSRRERKRLEREQRAAALTPEEQQQREALADVLGVPVDSLDEKADTVPPSKMKFTFSGDNPAIPGQSPVLSFDVPVSRLDASGIQLIRLDQPERQSASGRAARARNAPEPQESLPVTEVPVRLELHRDSLHIRQFELVSEWKDGSDYRLFIPPGAIETIDGERNDSITRSIKVARNGEMGTVTLNLANAKEGFEYIVQIMSADGKNILREATHLTEGIHSIHYITPGTITLKMIEDRNANGQWDTGNLVARIQPEEVRRFPGGGGEAEIDLKAGVEFEIDVDLAQIFKPRTQQPKGPDEEHDHGHDHAHEAVPVSAAGQEPEADESGRVDVRSSEARVEEYELIDLKADKKARKAEKRAAHAARKAERQAARQTKAGGDQ